MNDDEKEKEITESTLENCEAEQKEESNKAKPDDGIFLLDSCDPAEQMKELSKYYSPEDAIACFLTLQKALKKKDIDNDISASNGADIVTDEPKSSHVQDSDETHDQSLIFNPPSLTGESQVQTEAETDYTSWDLVPQQSGSNVYIDNRSVFYNPVFNSGSSEDYPVSSPWGNYEVKPLLIRKSVNRFGDEMREDQEIVAEVRISGYRPERFTLRNQDLTKLTNVISSLFPQAYLFNNAKTASHQIEVTFRDALKNTPVQYSFVDFGWQLIGGKYVYAEDSLNPSEFGFFETGRRFSRDASISPSNAGKFVLSLMYLYDDAMVMHTLIAVMLTGVDYKLFESVEFPFRSVFFMYGPSGSMKTALATVLFVQLQDAHGSTDLRRIDQDTEASLEVGLSESGYDTITVFDDFAPPKSTADKRKKDTNLELIIRMTGDGRSKSRSNGRLEDKRGEGISGSVVVTGELTGRGNSSLLRCFFCPFEKGKTNLDLLTKLQDNPKLVPTVMFYYAQYLGDNWASLQGLIRENVPKEREFLREYLTEPRIIDAAASLRLRAMILGRFLTEYCGLENDAVTTFVTEMQSSILQLAVINEHMASEEPAVEQIARAIILLINNGELKLLPDTKPDQLTFPDVDGYTDKGYIYFRPESLYQKLSKYFASRGMKLSVNEPEMTKQLIEDGIAVRISNGHTEDGSKKFTNYARISIGDKKHVLFIKVDAHRLEKYDNE